MPNKEKDRESENKPTTLEATPPDIKMFLDIAYRDGNSDAWKLDLATLAEPDKGPRPGIVFLHAGGWRMGDKKDFEKTTFVHLVRQGYVCVTANYRLCQEAPFPAAVEDAKCVVRWLRAHANEYQVDRARIGAFGASAGAHLSLMLALVPPDAGLEGDGPYQEQSSMVQAVVSVCGPTDFPAFLESSTDPDAVSDFVAGPRETFVARLKRASPMTYVNSNAPPFLVIHGTEDRTVPVDQATRLVAALRDAGAKDVTYLPLEDAGHAGIIKDYIGQILPAVDRFFERSLKGRRDGKGDLSSG